MSVAGEAETEAEEAPGVVIDGGLRDMHQLLTLRSFSSSFENCVKRTNFDSNLQLCQKVLISASTVYDTYHRVQS
jgi:regulator of RNase E activity RraA